MLKAPLSGSIPIYIALGLLIMSLALLIRFTYKRVYSLIHRLQRKPIPRVGIVTSTLRLLLILLAVAVSAAILFLFAFIQSYKSFTHRALVAEAYCTPVPGEKDKMTLWLLTFESPPVGYLSQYRLGGHQWAIEGHVLKWNEWLNFLGLQTLYKLSRVRGRYLRAEDERSKPATAYNLVANEEDFHWRWLYEYGARLPFVTAVYGNTVFTFPNKSKTFQIYVTTSGFMIKEMKK